MQGIGIVINEGERRIFCANSYWLEIVHPGSSDHTHGASSQLAIGRREDADPESNSSEIVLKEVLARIKRWCYIQTHIELDANGIAPAWTMPDHGWQFEAQAAEADPPVPLPLPGFNRDRLPIAPQEVLV